MTRARLAAVACALTVVAVAHAVAGPAPLASNDAEGAGPRRAVGTAGTVGISDVPTLTRRVGLSLPVAAPPVGIEISRARVRSEVVAVGLGGRGEILVPSPDRVGWYEGSVSPGMIGPAILVGHVDSKTGPAVFYGLASLRAGDRVVVERADGSRARFAVVRIARYRRAQMPASVYAMTSEPALRLITCGGPYDPRTGYRDNVVVYAAPA